MAEREVHIWMDKIGFDEFENTAYLCTTYAETRVMIDADQEVIHTTQPHFCQFEFGRILYIRMAKYMRLQKENVKERSVKFDRRIILRRC